jgi:hypothetical protein
VTIAAGQRVLINDFLDIMSHEELGHDSGQDIESDEDAVDEEEEDDDDDDGEDDDYNEVKEDLSNDDEGIAIIMEIEEGM